MACHSEQTHRGEPNRSNAACEGGRSTVKEATCLIPYGASTVLTCCCCCCCWLESCKLLFSCRLDAMCGCDPAVKYQSEHDCAIMVSRFLVPCGASLRLAQCFETSTWHKKFALVADRSGMWVKGDFNFRQYNSLVLMPSTTFIMLSFIWGKLCLHGSLCLLFWSQLD